jgi:hypothetical protein
MSTETAQFHIGTILSITDGHLVSPDHVGGVYKILNHMTGDDLMTHQLPRASRECEANLREQHPDLAAIVVPDGLDSREKVAPLIEQYGETREVLPLPASDHTTIGPLTELAMMRPDGGVLVVYPGITS